MNGGEHVHRPVPLMPLPQVPCVHAGHVCAQPAPKWSGSQSVHCTPPHPGAQRSQVVPAQPTLHSHAPVALHCTDVARTVQAGQGAQVAP